MLHHICTAYTVRMQTKSRQCKNKSAPTTGEKKKKKRKKKQKTHKRKMISRADG